MRITINFFDEAAVQEGLTFVKNRSPGGGNAPLNTFESVRLEFRMAASEAVREPRLRLAEDVNCKDSPHFDHLLRSSLFG